MFDYDVIRPSVSKRRGLSGDGQITKLLGNCNHCTILLSSVETLESLVTFAPTQMLKSQCYGKREAPGKSKYGGGEGLDSS